jgi:putative addiction module component (TIGR02574 family)
MSREELLAEILRLPSEERRGLIGQAIDSLPESVADPDMTAALRAELERRYQDMLKHPEDELTWDQASKELDRRKSRHP